MSYTKNLGRVKGKQGNYYKPNMYIDRNQGKLVFEWEETNIENEDDPIDETVTKSIDMPIFIPSYNPVTGDLIFAPTVPIKIGNDIYDPDDENFNSATFTFHVKGEKGDPGNVSLKIVHTNKTISELNTQLSIEKEQLENQEIDEISFTSDTIYFAKTSRQNFEQAYIYDDIKEEFFMMEGLDLSEYYTKSQTYNRNEIDDIVDIQNTYLEKIYELLDVPSDTYSIGGQEVTNEMLEGIIEDKMRGYVKVEDIKYVDIEGTIYFVQIESSEEEPNNGE
jgi:hypothetical protein